MAEVKVKLDNGFGCTVDDDIFDDMELVEDLAETEENPLKIRNVLNRVLGEEQKKALYESVRDPKSGRVPVEEGSKALFDIMSKVGESGKNS